jgi:hypothetical protein
VVAGIAGLITGSTRKGSAEVHARIYGGGTRAGGSV